MHSRLETTSNALPHYLTRFIGRGREIRKLKELLTATPPARMVTLTGVGGCGKTRLAIEAVRAVIDREEQSTEFLFGDGVHWVSLSSLRDAELLPQTIAAAMGLREAAGHSPAAALLAALRHASLLLVLDNCDHLASDCGMLAEKLLSSCPDLVILTTSRVPLNVELESIYSVPPLTTVDVGTGAAGAYLAQSEAVRLFLDRASSVLSAYAIDSRNALTINQICRRLDGLPLAIELAASWIRALSTQDILTQIEQNLDFLSSSEPTLAPRHRSMRAVLDTSWGRLTEEERRVFAALAVFRGSFSREAAEAVAVASLSSLATLAENSLIQRLPGGEGSTRYQVHEVVHQYAQDRLQTYYDDSIDRIRTRHINFFLTMAEQAAQVWDTAEETAWLRRLNLERDNLQAAARRAITQEQVEEALRMSAALFTFWIYTSPPDEYGELLRRSLALEWDEQKPGAAMARAKAANVAGYAAIIASDYALAEARFEEGLTLYTRLGDERGISWSLRGCGFATLLRGEANRASPYVEQSLNLSRESGDDWGEAWAIYDLGHIAFALGDLKKAKPLLEDALVRFKQIGILFGAHRALILLGDVQRRRSRWADAVTHYAGAHQLEQENRFTQFGADLLEGLGKIAVVQRQPDATARLFGAGDAWRETFGMARSFFYESGYRKTIEVARAQLSEHDWESAYNAGRGFSSDEAMAEASRVLQALAEAPLKPYPAGLTEREVEVLCLVVQGLKDQEIADQLVISLRTVHAHLRSIYGKLDVTTRTAAAHQAVRLKLA